MNERTLTRALLLLVVTAIGIGFYLILNLQNTPRQQDSETGTETGAIEKNPYSAFRIPEFTLTDRGGQPVTHELLDGEYTVLDFFFTSCPLYCPTMTAAMRRVQDETQRTGLRFMSISIDGDLDSPEIIGSYADRNGADPDRWAWLTGDPEYVRQIALEGIKFDIGDPNEEDTGRLITHPVRLILLGPDRRVIGLYRYDDEAQINALIAKTHELLGP